MCSFIFILIRAVTNEVKTAHVAQYIEQHVTRNYFTFWLTDTASLWLQNHTAFQFCVECAEFVIDEEFLDIHDSCLNELRRLDQLERDAEEAYEQELRDEEEARHQIELQDEHDAERARYETFLEDEDFESDEQFDDEDDICQECGSSYCMGDHCDRCGESILCVCAEEESLRRYNATPLEERDGPWTA